VRSPDEFEFEYSVQCKLPPVVGLSRRMFVQDDRSRSRSSRLRTQTIPVNIINQISLNDVWRCKCKLKTENWKPNRWEPKNDIKVTVESGKWVEEMPRGNGKRNWRLSKQQLKLKEYELESESESYSFAYAMKAIKKVNITYNLQQKLEETRPRSSDTSL